MSDNIKAIEQRVDLEIDPNGAPGSILATNHNGILKEVLSKVGKYSGSSYNANKTLVVFPSGSMSWNNNAMNTVVDFTITVSKLTAELNDFGELLNRIEKGALIRFKDYVGRNVYLLFQSFVADVDGSANDIYIITVKGVAQNINYTYQVAEVEPCIITIEAKSDKTKVVHFVATHNQVSFTVPENQIDDNGLWIVQVGSSLLNSTTGLTSFAQGGITINFATGEITFNDALQGGTQVIIKYNSQSTIPPPL